MRNSPLIDAIMPRVRQGILSATLLQPDRRWYASELARHLRLRPSTLQRELGALARVGILKTSREGRMTYFQADAKSPVFPELTGLMTKTAGLVDVMRAALAPLKDRIALSFVFGSIAKREESSHSDVDLMVIGSVGLNNLVAELRSARDLLGREINPKLYRAEEFAKRIAANDHFLIRVLAKPKLFVIGSVDALEQLTQSKHRRSRANQQSRAG